MWSPCLHRFKWNSVWDVLLCQVLKSPFLVIFDMIQVKKKARHDINGVLFRRREWLSEEKIVSRKKLKMIRTRNSIMAFLITSWLALSFQLLLKDMKLRQIKRARSDIKTGEESKVFYFKFRAVLFFFSQKKRFQSRDFYVFIYAYVWPSRKIRRHPG